MTKQDYERLIEQAREQVATLGSAKAKASQAAWALGDTLAKIEITKPGGAPAGTHRVKLQTLADDLGLGKAWVMRLRNAALDFPPELRVPEVSVTVHRHLLQALGKPSLAHAKLKALYAEHGDKLTMQDVAPDQRDEALLRAMRDKQTIERLANKLSSVERSFVMGAMRSPSVTLGHRVEGNGKLDDSDVLRVLTTMRRVHTMIEHVAADVRGTHDERIAAEVSALESAVAALVEAVAATA